MTTRRLDGNSSYGEDRKTEPLLDAGFQTVLKAGQVLIARDPVLQGFPPEERLKYTYSALNPEESQTVMEIMLEKYDGLPNNILRRILTRYKADRNTAQFLPGSINIAFLRNPALPLQVNLVYSHDFFGMGQTNIQWKIPADGRAITTVDEVFMSLMERKERKRALTNETALILGEALQVVADYRKQPR